MDMSSGVEVDRIRKIEQDLFVSFIKKEVEAEQGSWIGSVENNRLADKRVAAIVKTSFKNYEKNKKKFEPAYFVKKEV